MKRFFTNNGILLLAAIAIIVTVLCVMSAIGSGLLRNLMNTVAAPFRSAGAAVSSWIEGIDDHFDSVEALQSENEELRQQIAELERQIYQTQQSAEENRRLRSLLSLQQQRFDLQFTTAKIVDWSDTNWTRRFTVSIGSGSDVTKGNCVVDQYGDLVGIVTAVGYNWADVTAITDTSCAIGVRVFRTDDIAVAQGDLSLMSDDTLKLTYLGSDISLINGDLLLTSGLGGNYPAGLAVGSVGELRSDEGGLDRYAVITPAADLNSLRQVFIITSFDVVE